MGHNLLNKAERKTHRDSEKHSPGLVQKVADLVNQEKLIDPGDRVLLGISGGIDSTTLLFVLLEIQKKMDFTLGLAHINHMLRDKESVRDEEFVKKLAGRLQLPFFLKKINIKKIAIHKKLSIQHAGREARYGAFNEITAKYDYNKIAIAHNLDDQIETFLLRALKGTGLKGLSAIPIKRGTIIRPFLHTYRMDIARYADEQTIPFVQDSSNDKIVYERNFLRKEIFPIMERLNPLFKEKLFSLLNDLTYINHFFEERSQLFLKKHQTKEREDILLAVESLNTIDNETKFRVISDITTSLEPTFVLLREHFRLISKILSSTKPNLIANLPHEIKIKKVYNHLIFTKKPLPSPPRETFSLSMGKNILTSFTVSLHLSLPRKTPSFFLKNENTAFFDKDKLGSLTIRTFMNGDTFMPLGMSNKIKLKDFFISSKIPKEKRRMIPLLLSDNDIVWVVGLRIDERFKITKGTKKILKVTATHL
jgi:tRNA(Ile)-lysidine synthase